MKREMVVMNREMIVEKLIESQIDSITRHGCGIWLHQILEGGFKGFGNMSDRQLLREMEQRGLKAEFSNEPWPLDDDEEPEAEDEDLREMLEACASGDERAG